jgi:hypothetical protein
MGHATMANRHGLAVAGTVAFATGTDEHRASEIMLKAKAKKAGRRITVGEDKAYDTADHVANLRALNVTPHGGAEREHHRNRQAPAERHRRTHYAAQRLRSIAIVPGDDRMHLRLGQTARHDAQNNTSRHNQGHY